MLLEQIRLVIINRAWKNGRLLDFIDSSVKNNSLNIDLIDKSFLIKLENPMDKPTTVNFAKISPATFLRTIEYLEILEKINNATGDRDKDLENLILIYRAEAIEKNLIAIVLDEEQI
jgi:hypothetical protein